MNRPDVALLQHAPSEGGGVMEEYLLKLKVPVHRIELFSTNELPPLSSTHLLVMGGPMSVNDEEEYSWIRDEKELIRRFVERGAPLLGICLGAQLIAAAGGARVYPCNEELGWSPVYSIPGRFALLPKRFLAFQMHGETFDLPTNATLICRGDIVAHQAFCWRSALGLQFHLELTGKILADWTGDLPAEKREIIRNVSRVYLPQSRRLAELVIARFLAAPGSGFSWLREKA
jgi:GMP synthase-like glutamine amidotransferase